MRTYDLPYTRRALSIHFELLRTHEDRGHILYIKHIFFLADIGVSKTSIFPHVAELSIPVLTGSDWLNKWVERMAVRGGLSPPQGPTSQSGHFKHSPLDSINKLIIQLKNESLSRSLL